MCSLNCILICCALFTATRCSTGTGAILKGQAQKLDNSDGDECNTDFKFDEWVTENNLHDIRDLLVKHEMISPETLNANAPAFVELITDPEFSAKGRTMATKLLAAIQQMKVIRIYITKEEEEAIDQLKQYNEQILLLKREIQDAKDSLIKNAEECEQNIDISFN
eukprot:527934_1